MARPRNKNGLATQTMPTCGCAARTGRASDSPQDRERAMGVDASIKSANLKHLRRIEGQIRGIAAMVEDDRYCADIITQVSAVRESLHAVARNLMGNHLRHCAATAMARGGDARQEMIDELLDLVGKISR